MTDHEDIVASTIRLAEARTAQARAEADLFRAKLGADAPGAADKQTDANWIAPLFHRRTRRLDISGQAHDIRQDGPKPTQPRRPEQTTHQKRTNQIRQDGQLFPQVPGAKLTIDNEEK